MGGWGGFLVITVSHPTFCCVGVGLWLRWGWAVTIEKALKFGRISLSMMMTSLLSSEISRQIIIKRPVRCSYLKAATGDRKMNCFDFLETFLLT